MDLDSRAMEDALTTCRAMVLCNPHNPTGRTWRARLFTGGFVPSTECWLYPTKSGLTVLGEKATPLPHFAMWRWTQAAAVLLLVPTKTFSTAGVHAAFVVIEDPDLKAVHEAHNAYRLLYKQHRNNGHVATRIWKPWLQVVKVHAQKHRLLGAYLGEHIPLIHVLRPEATYNVWLDCSGLQLSPSDLNDFMLNKARIILGRGADFGPEDQ